MVDAGFDQGEFQNLQVDIPQIEPIIGDRRVHAVGFTGSTRGGRAVASLAGKYLKRCTTELGGSDVCIVLDDVDIVPTAKLAAAARLRNSGQVCISSKRFIIHETIYDKFLEALEEEVKTYNTGDPTSEDTQLGPIARKDLLEELKKQVRTSLEEGANLRFGDRDQLVADDDLSKGFFFTPIILDQIPEGSTPTKDEFFGPVFSVFKASSDEEAAKIANASTYGLGSLVLTPDVVRGEKLARKLEAGNAYVNKCVTVDVRLPYGGVKDSGLGREGREGIREFMNTKTVVVKKTI